MPLDTLDYKLTTDLTLQAITFVKNVKSIVGNNQITNDSLSTESTIQSTGR